MSAGFPTAAGRKLSDGEWSWSRVSQPELLSQHLLVKK